MNYLRLAAFISMLWVSQAYAAPASSLLSMPTTSRTIYLLFVKMTGRTFTPQSTIEATDVYKAANAAGRAQIMAQQKPLLESEYAAIDTEKQLLVVRTSVAIHAELSPRPGLDVTLDPDGKPASAIYFPYRWADTGIALIPDKLEPFLSIPLKVTEATAAAARIRDNTATMVIEMLPISADKRSSMVLDGVDQWLLMTRIVSVAYYNQGMETIWQWQAPDYRRADAPSPLQDLKK